MTLSRHRVLLALAVQLAAGIPAVDDPVLVWAQLQAGFPHPLFQRGQRLADADLVLAMNQGIAFLHKSGIGEDELRLANARRIILA